MTLKLNCYRFKIPLQRQFSFGRHQISTREGIALCIQNSDGSQGWGEVSPLPGLHQHTIKDVESSLPLLLEHFRRLIQLYASEPNSSSWQEALMAQIDQLQLLPVLHYGFELALLNSFSSQSERPLSSLLGGRLRDVVNTNILLDLNTGVAQLTDLLSHGTVTAVKLKVGQGSPTSDARRVREVARELSEGIALRLDANRMWSLPEAFQFAASLGSVALEYIEEPIDGDYAMLAEFCSKTGLPVALDESLNQLKTNPIPTDLPINALILKPSVLGGLRACIRLVLRLRKSRPVKAVVSCPFESGIGLTASAVLASILEKESVAAGLETYRWLKHDIISPAFEVPEYHINVAALESTPYIVEDDCLERIE